MTLPGAVDTHRKTARRALATCALAAFAWLTLSTPAAVVRPCSGDMVRLKNGDVLSGKVTGYSSGKIGLTTDHSGDILVDVEQVVDIDTREILTVEYEDGREVDGYLDVEEGKVVVRETPAETPPDPSEDLPADIDVVDISEIASIAPVTPYYRFEGHLDLGVNVAKGNSDSENINLAGLIKPSWGKNTIQIDGQWNRGKADGDLAASNWRINGQYEREFWEKWFWLIFNSYDHDRLQDLDLRITTGAGLGYKFFEPDPTLLKVSLSPAFVDENFEGSSDDRQFAALRWTLDFDQDIFSPDVSVYHNHRLTIGLTEDQFIAQTAQGVKFDLIADFALKFEFQFDRNNKPADDADKNDYRYLAKITYDFRGDENDWWQ